MKSGEVKLFIGILIIAVLMVGITILPTYMAKKRDAIPPPGEVDINRQLLLSSELPAKGNPAAPYTLVEFGDFLCPACKASIPEVDGIQKKRPELKVIFRHFKASRTHVNSYLLSQALDAGRRQGKFWPMIDRLFSIQDEMENMSAGEVNNAVMKIASELKMNIIRFKSDMTDKAAVKGYEDQQKLGDKIGITSTPTFFFIKPQGKPIMLHTRAQLTAYLGDEKNWK